MNKAPKTIAELNWRLQYNINGMPNNLKEEAARLFSQEYGEDYRPDLPVVCRHLFGEVDSNGRNVSVCEVYKDSGSEEYIYLKIAL